MCSVHLKGVPYIYHAHVLIQHDPLTAPQQLDNLVGETRMRQVKTTPKLSDGLEVEMITLMTDDVHEVTGPHGYTQGQARYPRPELSRAVMPPFVLPLRKAWGWQMCECHYYRDILDAKLCAFSEVPSCLPSPPLLSFTFSPNPPPHPHQVTWRLS